MSVVGAALSCGCADPSASAEVGVYVGSGGATSDGPLGSGGETEPTESTGGVRNGSGGSKIPTKPIPTGAGGAKTAPPPTSLPPVPSVQDAQAAFPDALGNVPPLNASGCLPGAYTGTFTCPVVSQPGVAPAQVQGTLHFSLAPSTSNPFLMTVSSGAIESPNAAFTFTAGLSGQLDCITGAIHSDATGTGYAGRIDGQLDRATQFLSGLFWVSPTAAPLAPASCAGTWNAQPIP
jgi:hypothetical protein